MSLPMVALAAQVSTGLRSYDPGSKKERKKDHTGGPLRQSRIGSWQWYGNMLLLWFLDGVRWFDSSCGPLPCYKQGNNLWG